MWQNLKGCLPDRQRVFVDGPFYVLRTQEPSYIRSLQPNPAQDP